MWRAHDIQDTERGMKQNGGSVASKLNCECEPDLRSLRMWQLRLNRSPFPFHTCRNSTILTGSLARPAIPFARELRLFAELAPFSMMSLAPPSLAAVSVYVAAAAAEVALNRKWIAKMFILFRNMVLIWDLTWISENIHKMCENVFSSRIWYNCLARIELNRCKKQNSKMK